MNDTGPLTPWQLAERLFPLDTADYRCWIGADYNEGCEIAKAALAQHLSLYSRRTERFAQQEGRTPKEDMNSQLLQQIERYLPTGAPPQRYLQEKAMNHCGAQRARAQALLKDMQRKLRERLLSAPMIVSGRRNGDGDRVVLTLDDLVGLEFDLATGSLNAHQVGYTEITIRTPGKSGQLSAPAQLPLGSGGNANALNTASDAIRALWPETHPPGKQKEICERVNKWLSEPPRNYKGKIQRDTLRRALKQHKQEIDAQPHPIGDP